MGIGPTAAVAEGRGTINLMFTIKGKVFRHRLNNVLYVPGAPNCLVSLGQIDDTGVAVTFKDGLCFILDKKGDIIGEGHKRNRLYKLHARAEHLGQEQTNYVAPVKLTWNQWHCRFRHIAITALQQLLSLGRFLKIF